MKLIDPDYRSLREYNPTTTYYDYNNVKALIGPFISYHRTGPLYFHSMNATIERAFRDKDQLPCTQLEVSGFNRGDANETH